MKKGRRPTLWAFVLVALLPLTAVGQTEQPSPVTATPSGNITLNVVDQDIGSVLRMLSEAQRVNVIAGPEVTGTISINLYNVPFDTALKAVLSAAGFTSYRAGGIIFVTTEEKLGELPPGTGEMQVESFELNHVEPPDVVDTLSNFLSKGGKALPGANRTIVVVDTPERLSIISQLIKALDQAKRQVLIQVHIVNVERNDNMNVGTGFDTFPLKLYGAEALSQGFAEPFPPGIDPETNEIDTGEIPTATGFFAGTLQKDFRAYIQALETATDTEVLASPQLLVLDGETAHLQVGDRLGFRITTTTETASLESVEFLEVGTVLEVTPSISSDGLVSMKINPKVSSGFIDNDGLPSESTTEVSTNMIVQDGQTVIIGGLLNATKQRIKSQIPFLGDIPIIGKLFGRNSWTDDQAEVVVFLTPQIISPKLPPASMKEKVEDATQRFQPFEEKGLINDESWRMKGSPSKRWRNMFQQRGALQVRAPESTATESPEKAGTVTTVEVTTIDPPAPGK